MSLEIKTHKEYEILHPIGEGLSSDIYKGIRKDHKGDFHQLVAVKVYRSGQFKKKFQTELKNLSEISHESIPRVIDWRFDSEQPLLVTEYINGCDLQKFLNINGRDSLSLKQKRYIVDCLHKGVLALYENGLCHGDLKPSNVMLSSDGKVKLIDICLDDYGCVYATPDFSAPEVLSGTRPNYKSDLYSIGLIAKALGLNEFDSLNRVKPGLRSYVKRRFGSVDNIKESLSILVLRTQPKLGLLVTSENKSKESAVPQEQTLKLSRQITQSLSQNFSVGPQELHSRSRSYSDSLQKMGSRLLFGLKVRCIKLKIAHLDLKYFGIILMVTGVYLFLLTSEATLEYPRYSKVKLRSLKAIEVWDQGQWNSLPYDFTRSVLGSKKINLRLRTYDVNKSMRISLKAYNEKLIAIDAL